MHWLGYNDAVSWLNKVKTQPTTNFEIFKFCPPAYLPALRPSCARCRASEISHDKVMVANLQKCYSEDPLHHSDFFYPSFPFFIPLARCEPHIQR